MPRSDWRYSLDHDEPCRIVSSDTLWGEDSCLAWLPRSDSTVRLSLHRVLPLEECAAAITCDHLTTISAAARIADSMAQDALVAPLEGSLIPLPHQIHVLARAMAGDRVRYLLADEVGLGKTIEAGMILRELKIRGMVRRILVVAPAGLVSQWVSEMETHFNESFRLVLPGTFKTWRQIMGVDEHENLWRHHDQVVCPVDSVKPVDSRKGWLPDRVAQYNRERFEDLVSAGWDLIIVDEAHRLGGSTEQVARYRLGEGLAQAAPYLLLLTATPHQGKTDAFRRVISFLDSEALPDDASVCRENVAPYVIRTEKRTTIDADGEPLFKPRQTQLFAVAWEEARHEQQALYESVTDYVRVGYNQARRDKKTAIGFLMILMQRLVTSSTAAIRTALERRLAILELPQGQLSLFAEDIGDDWVDLDGQDQMESLLKSRLKGLKNERAEVELLLSAARKCEARGPDIKAEALLAWVQRLQQEENDPSLKVLVFTEFVPTQAMLSDYLTARGYPVVCLNGSMDLEERKEVQRAFANEAQVLVSTDAGGEGLNLQFCHVVINYDLPWNPMKLEQRIGRVDRIGQAHVVRAVNFSLEGTVELRVREVLEEKLQKILDEFGVDKLSDVLDSEEGDVNFDKLYVGAVVSPESAEARAADLAEDIRQRARASRDGASVLGATKDLDPGAAQKVAGHQMPYWTERMTVAYLRSRGEGLAAAEDEVGYRLRWPDGSETKRAVFTQAEARRGDTEHVTLEDPRIRGLTTRLAFFAPGQPLATVEIPGVSEMVSGIWSLWKVGLITPLGSSRRLLPLFVSDDGRVLGPTARLCWDRLIEGSTGELRLKPAAITGEEALQAHQAALDTARDHGEAIFRELADAHRERLHRERKKTTYAFDARRRAIQRVGLPQVRSHRLARLEHEEKDWRAAREANEAMVPDLSAVLMLRVGREGECS